MGLLLTLKTLTSSGQHRKETIDKNICNCLYVCVFGIRLVECWMEGGMEVKTGGESAKEERREARDTEGGGSSLG